MKAASSQAIQRGMLQARATSAETSMRRGAGADEAEQPIAPSGGQASALSAIADAERRPIR